MLLLVPRSTNAVESVIGVHCCEEKEKEEEVCNVLSMFLLAHLHVSCWKELPA